MKAVELCCGAGGLSCGLLQAGIDVMLGVDIWEEALEVYRRNVRRPTLPWDLSRPELPRALRNLPPVDLVCGGTPCQDFSTGGLKVEAQRAKLTLHFAFAAARLRPRFIVMENVPPARTKVAYILAKDYLRVQGYGLTEVEVECCYYGVPQLRSRLLLVGELGGEDDALRDLLLAGASERPLTVREHCGDRIGTEFYYRHYWGNATSGRKRCVWSVDETGPTITTSGHRVPDNYRPRKGDATKDLSKVRALTVSEASLIQTFPEDWDWLPGVIRTSDAYRMVGNAVPPKLAEHLGRALLAAARRPVRGPTAGPFQVHLADCRSFDWPQVDLLFTDPPYKDLAAYEWLGRMGAEKLRPGRLALVYADPFRLPEQVRRLTAGGLRYVATFAISYPLAAASRPLLGFIAGNLRPVVVLSQGKLEPPGRMVFAAQTQKRYEKRWHKWEQAVEPAIEWIGRLAPLGGLVADPYLGGATTAVAVRRVGGLRFVGTEIDPDAYRSACRRLAEEGGAAA